MNGSTAIRIDESAIAREARRQLKESPARIVLRQAWSEFLLSWRKSVRFRWTENARAVRAYCEMSVEEFEGINARQRWSDWRTIPRNISGRLPDSPCRAVDLCSGLGHSTQVLAYYLPAGSKILGLEYNSRFVETAALREYRRRDGRPAEVSFSAQSVLESFRDPSGRLLPDSSVDLVNSCGALGVHFDPPAIERIVAETARILKEGGLATIDSGTRGVPPAEMRRLFSKRGFVTLGSTRSCVFDRYVHICFRKNRP